jgi:hypothetical protein
MSITHPTTNVSNECITKEEAGASDISVVGLNFIAVESVIDFYSIFCVDEELRSMVEDRVNVAANYIVSVDAVGVDTSNVTYFATALLKQILCYMQKNPEVANYVSVSAITKDDISQAIKMNVLVQSMNSVHDFYSSLGNDIKLRAIVEHRVNLAADFILAFDSGGEGTYSDFSCTEYHGENRTVPGAESKFSQ